MQNWFEDKISNAKVLDFSMEIYRKKFKSLIGYQILFSIISILLVVAGGLILIPMLSLMHLSGVFGFVVFAFITFIAFSAFVCINKAGVFHMAHSYIKGEDMGASEAVGKAFGSFRPVVRVVTALALCLVPIFVILGIAGVTITSITALQSKLASSTIVALLVNVLFYAVIAATVGSYLFYSFHIAIFDKAKGFEAIGRSIHFAKGEVLKNIFRVLSISMFEWGVNLSVYGAIAAMSGLLYFVLGKMQGGASIVTQIMLYGGKLEPFVNFIVGTLIAPIGPIIWTFYYINMKYRKEGLKMHHILDRLEQQDVEEYPKNIDIVHE
ncbi:hypothetical protein QBE52_06315 [Clostridiaceae bacterium 35-E11]